MTGEKETARAAQTRLRSDAQRNRDDILAAAVLAFTKDANASLEGIAKAAGVGIGALYRHYPTREALVEAAYRTKIKKLCDEAPRLLEKPGAIGLLIPRTRLAAAFALFLMMIGGLVTHLTHGEYFLAPMPIMYGGGLYLLVKESLPELLSVHEPVRATV